MKPFNIFIIILVVLILSSIGAIAGLYLEKKKYKKDPSKEPKAIQNGLTASWITLSVLLLVLIITVVLRVKNARKYKKVPVSEEAKKKQAAAYEMLEKMSGPQILGAEKLYDTRIERTNKPMEKLTPLSKDMSSDSEEEIAPLDFSDDDF